MEQFPEKQTLPTGEALESGGVAEVEELTQEVTNVQEPAPIDVQMTDQVPDVVSDAVAEPVQASYPVHTEVAFTNALTTIRQIRVPTDADLEALANSLVQEPI